MGGRPPRTARLVEESPNIWAKELRARGLLDPGSTHTIIVTGLPDMPIELSTSLSGESFTLSYRWQGVPLLEVIQPRYVSTRRGRFLSLVCPACSKGTQRLYFPLDGDGRFKCRHCHKLRYAGYGRADYPLHRAERIWLKLTWGSDAYLFGADQFGGLPPKPRGMSWDKYWRLAFEFLRFIQLAVSRGAGRPS